MLFSTYILANYRHGTLYVGVTNDLEKRLEEHRRGTYDGFTKRYAIHRLVYFELFDNPRDAIEREKELKRWHRAWKINLIEKNNPYWKNLSRDFMDPETSSG